MKKQEEEMENLMKLCEKDILSLGCLKNINDEDEWGREFIFNKVVKLESHYLGMDGDDVKGLCIKLLKPVEIWCSDGYLPKDIKVLKREDNGSVILRYTIGNIGISTEINKNNIMSFTLVN